ncbi:hypothetical protein [Sphingomonas zeae]|uniref:Uncharacterized protein n=3 Tax=Sphingomonas TaxID=13687 RepID=A0A369VXR4_9SPHN|nr:hypothetical protein [Sphingomonas zeae]MBB4047677.1 hypothetical protein [Sphingomonas zeae]NUU47654.1 hypothetical protein [Sphingomonas zeae]RDE06629.1 hypothetical protein DVW87_02700 [Sphingomonas aracearum]
MKDGNEVLVHDDAIAAVLVTLKIEITDAAKVRNAAEDVYRGYEARIGQEPTEGEVDSMFGSPDAPDLPACINFLFPSHWSGADVLDIGIDVVDVHGEADGTSKNADADEDGATTRSPTEPAMEPTHPVTFQHVLDGISEVINAPADPDKTRASLKHLRRKGFPSAGKGSGRALEYTRDEFVLILIAYHLMSIGLTPEYTAAIVTANAEGILADHDEVEEPFMFFQPRAVNDSFDGTVPPVSFIARQDILAAITGRGAIFLPLKPVKRLAARIAP